MGVGIVLGQAVDLQTVGMPANLITGNADAEPSFLCLQFSEQVSDLLRL